MDGGGALDSAPSFYDVPESPLISTRNEPAQKSIDTTRYNALKKKDGTLDSRYRSLLKYS